ncbi:unnamed protein product [Candida verbasci]|uniref:Protein NRD1 n=1 Tax=Candida verbasci TaxID=1227364 RepID=A0A9W4TX17_9ASCO|nr:unnamed protein product [Candida verbasci]
MSNTDPINSFNTILKELQDLPPPGVSGSRIKKLTDIALQNFNEDNESKIVTSLYSNCKSINSKNKLGMLYVIDSIVRKYKDEADKNNLEISSNSEEGTFASAVFKISELIESIVDDALEFTVDPATNLKISKLIDIWDKYETFPSDIIKNIKIKHFPSYTPPGTPPKTSVEPIKPKNNAQNESNSILASLASLASLAPKSSTPPSAHSDVNPNPSQQQTQQHKNVETNNILSQLSALAGNNNTTTTNTNNNNNEQISLQQVQTASPPAANNEQLILNMLQQMQGQNVAQSQVPENNYRSSRDTSVAKRDRSRSPRRTSRPAPSPSIASLKQNLQHLKQIKAQQQQQQQQQQFPAVNRQNSIQNSPPIQNQSAFVSPQEMGGELNLPGTAHYRPRDVGFDPSCAQGAIKVLSRTLFIGGVPKGMDERALAQVLRPFAEIQSVILNSERKHAFVKVYSRQEAEQVISNFNKDNSLPLRTRWGVGFGPRDCCNYQHGISIIPIQRLTDADKTWLVNSQWGGTGGQPISSGMCVVEPEIQVGAGLSSKALSQKMPTNSSRNGPKSNRPGEPDDQYVQTTLLGSNNIQMSHGAQPDFNTYQQSSINPLQQYNQPQHQQQQQQQQQPNTLPPNISEILMQAMQGQQQQPQPQQYQ